MKKFNKIYKILGVILFIIFLNSTRQVFHLCLLSYLLIWVLANAYKKGV